MNFVLKFTFLTVFTSFSVSKAAATCEDVLLRKIRQVARAKINQRFIYNGRILIPMDDFFQNYLSTAPAHFADLFAETDEDLDSEDKKIWDDSMSSGNEISSLSVFQAGTLSQLNISTGEPGRIHSHGAVILPIIDFLIRYNQQNNPSRVVFVRSLHTHPPRPETDHFSMSDLQVMYRLKILLELGGLENTAIQMQLLYQNEGSNPRKKTWTIPSSVSCFDGQYNMCPTFTLELAQFIERNPDISRIDLLRAYQASLLLEQ